jgi:DNA-binding NtrC family response regulator
MPEAEKQQVAIEMEIETLVNHERRYIASVLRQLGGDRQATASALGISLRGLQYIIARWRRDGYEVPESPYSQARVGAWDRVRARRKQACRVRDGG